MILPQIVSRIHRTLDSCQALLDPTKAPYRKALLRIVGEARHNWTSADYGAGYLYQSFPRIGLRGFRQTEVRVDQMAITDAITGHSVLEIGCNSGFLSLTLAPSASRYVAFDNNPFLIEIARLTQTTIGDASVEFSIDSVETFDTSEKFDIVLSFANHSTWDGNMKMPLESYFSKLHNLMATNGILFFESHHPALESTDQVRETLKVLQEFFVIEEQRLLMRGSAWDRGRTFVRARTKAEVSHRSMGRLSTRQQNLPTA